MTTTLLNYNLHEDGLHLQYLNKKFELCTLNLTKEQACEIFEQLGIIEGYLGSGEEVRICWEAPDVYPSPSGEPIEIRCIQDASFGEWFDAYSLSQKQAEIVCEYIEQQKEINHWAKLIRSIPKLIQSIK